MQLKCEISKILTNKAKTCKEFLFAINFDADEVIIFTPEDAAENGVYYDFEGKTNFSYLSDCLVKRFECIPVSYSDYKLGFDICRNALQRGDTYLINYTCKTLVETEYSQVEIFNASRAKFKLWVKDKFIIFSPERFIKIENGEIEARPMKGTIDASIENAESRLLNDKKELFEHNTIVDLLRNDLNMVSEKVIIEDFRYIESVKTINSELLQASSLIKGKINSVYAGGLGEIITKLLPAGSISGAPKEKTVEIIKIAEDYNREFYTGVFGYHSGGVTDIAVSIRFIEIDDEKMFYKSGGGITVNSNPIDEYNEMLSKIYVPIF